MIDVFENRPELFLGLGALVAMLIYNALKDRSDGRKQRRGEALDGRMTIYNRTLVFLWTLAGACTISWIWSGGTLAELGFRNPQGWQAWFSWGIVGLFLVYLIWSLAQVMMSRKAREDVRRQIRSSGDVNLLIPENAAEHRRFQWLSITAGVTEEIVFRGFLISVFALALPAWAAAIAATLIFVIAHAYQGLAGMARILPISAAFALVYVVGGSLWPVILLHILADAMAGLVVAITQNHADRDSAYTEPVQA